MGEDESGKLHEKETRPVLGNITNQLGKRAFSLISRSPPSKSKRGNTENADDADSDSNFWKQVSLVVEKLEKDRSGSVAKSPKIVHEVGLSPLKGGKTYRLLNTSADTRKELSKSALDAIDLDAGSVGETFKEGCVSEVKVGECSKHCERECVEGGEETREASDVVEVDCTPDGLGGTQVVSDSCRNLSVECLIASQSESAVSSRVVESQEMKGFGLGRCTALKGGDFAAGIDSIKNCSCSVCTKAGYIWADLHYQDIKGRISVLAKSQREASNLAQKYSAEYELGGQGQESFPHVAQLETDLTSHWRSLFLQLEDMFASEGSQLQNNIIALKDIREDYKLNLELINEMPLDVQQCSSDASDHTIV